MTLNAPACGVTAGVPASAPRRTKRVHNTDSVRLGFLPTAHLLGPWHHAHQAPSRIKAQKCKEVPGLPSSDIWGFSFMGEPSTKCLVLVLFVNVQTAASSHASGPNTKQIAPILRCHQRRGHKWVMSGDLYRPSSPRFQGFFICNT